MTSNTMVGDIRHRQQQKVMISKQEFANQQHALSASKIRQSGMLTGSHEVLEPPRQEVLQIQRSSVKNYQGNQVAEARQNV